MLWFWHYIKVKTFEEVSSKTSRRFLAVICMVLITNRGQTHIRSFLYYNILIRKTNSWLSLDHIEFRWNGMVCCTSVSTDRLRKRIAFLSIIPRFAQINIYGLLDGEPNFLKRRKNWFRLISGDKKLSSLNPNKKKPRSFFHSSPNHEIYMRSYLGCLMDLVFVLGILTDSNLRIRILMMKNVESSIMKPEIEPLETK